MKKNLFITLLFSSFLVIPLFLQAKINDNPLEKVNQLILKQTGQKIFFNEDELKLEKNNQKRLTLIDAINLALQNNPSIKQSLQEVMISKAELRQRALPENPEASVSFGFAHDDPGKVLPHIIASQNIFDFYLASLRKRASSSQLEEAKLKTANEIIELVTQVKKAFYTVQALEQFQDQLSQLVQSTQIAASLSERQFKAGNVNLIELNGQKLVLEQTKIELVRSEAESKVAKSKLAELLGHPEWSHKILVQKKLSSLPRKDLSSLSLEKIALSNRFDLIAMRQKNITLDRNYNLAKWEGFPKINLGVESDTEIEGGTRTGPEIGLQIPLFNRGQGSKEKVKAQIIQNQYAITAMENHIRQEIKESLARLSQARGIALRYQENILPLLNKTLDESQLHYNFMLKGSFDLLQIKREEIRSRRDFLEAVRDYWIESAHLEQLVGGNLYSTEEKK